MLENMQLWIYGTAAVIDTVLLFALLERHNWRAVTIWMLLLAVGLWCWHGGTFVRQLVDQSVGPLADPVRWTAMMSMAFGLMLMASSALHAARRLDSQGTFRISRAPDPRLAFCYLPLILLVPMGQALAVSPSTHFLVLLANYHIPYVIWLTLVSVYSAVILIRQGAASGHPPTRWFYRLMAVGLIAIAGLASSFVVVWRQQPGHASGLQMLVGLSPLFPAMLFGYFVMRFQLVPLILERTLVYGAVLVGAMLFHAVVLRDAVSEVAAQYRLDLGVVEGILALGIILLYQPLRDRVAAALQSLIDSSRERRDERRQLAVQLARRAGDAIPDLLNWFTDALRRSFGTDTSASWLCDRDGQIIHRTGSSELLLDGEVTELLATMSLSGVAFMTRYSATHAALLALLDRVRAGAVLRFQHPDISGLFLVGCRDWGQPPNDEDLHALSLLVEQFGVTLHNSQLQALQAAAEHQLAQQQKLSALGLLASSLAHEIKNPLSSIKTITRVMSEELGADSRHADDLRMIGGEIDRLSQSTSELLESARPPRGDGQQMPLELLLSPTIRLLQHLAREYRSKLDVRFPDQLVFVPDDQVGLREIVFNLVSNGLDAARGGGTVCLTCRRESPGLCIDVHDTGVGIAGEQLHKLFEPFQTTKLTGTGLGLYVVARRVREMGGTIECRSVPGSTTFELRLPLGNPS